MDLHSDAMLYGGTGNKTHYHEQGNGKQVCGQGGGGFEFWIDGFELRKVLPANSMQEYGGKHRHKNIGCSRENKERTGYVAWCVAYKQEVLNLFLVPLQNDEDAKQ